MATRDNGGDDGDQEVMTWIGFHSIDGLMA